MLGRPFTPEGESPVEIARGVGKGGDALAPCKVLGNGRAGPVYPGLRVLVEYGDKLSGIGIGKGPDQHRVHHREQGDVGPEAEGEGEERCGCEALVAREAPVGEPEVTDERVEIWHALEITRRTPEK